MIRRLFWMLVGAVAGVTGYRRVARLARAIQPRADRGARRKGWTTAEAEKWLGPYLDYETG